jgi:hypothetical protein
MADGTDEVDHGARGKGGFRRARGLLNAWDAVDLTEPLPPEGDPEDGAHMLVLDEVVYAANRGLVDPDDLLALIDSELFEIAAHPDLVERNTALRGLLTVDHYHEIASAFADSRTVPELNAGRFHDDYGAFHPAEDFVDVLLDRGVDFTVGSDAHTPERVRKNTASLSEAFAERGIEPVELDLS